MELTADTARPTNIINGSVIVVQLRAEQEALQQCRIDPTITAPLWHADPVLRQQLDSTVGEQVLDRLGGTGKKVLVIGAGWPELGPLLAQKGMFVTVVDDNAERIRAVQDKTNEMGGLGTVTCHVDDYSNRQFERAAFNRIVAWDVLNRFPTPDPIIRKMTRELKAGGLFCLRTWVRPIEPELPWTQRLGEWFKRLTGNNGGPLETAVLAAIKDHGGVPSHETAMPWTEAERVVGEHLVIQDIVPHHGLSSDIAELLAHGQEDCRPLLAQLLEAQADMPEATAETARYIAVFAANEKQLGSVFKLSD